MTEELEIFQDLHIRGPIERRPELREALIAAAVRPWSVDLGRSAEIARNAITSENIVLFRREQDDKHLAAGLTLWGTDDGYYVPNIVPMTTRSLTFAQYNAILMDFAINLAGPVSERLGFIVETTRAYQTLEDWLSADAAVKLRRFSGAANKSTGASHPMDQRRWFDFIVAAHRDGKGLGSDRLARWLHEVKGWEETTAHSLAGDYETALALLKHYDTY